MPVSRVRKKNKSVPVAAAAVRPRRKGASPGWFTGVMLTLFLIGIIWLVLYYATSGSLPGQSALGGWNVLVGFGFICLGFGLATQWR